MPKNVMKLMKPVAQHGSHDFDLSHRHLYGMNFGELLPSTFIETVPGDFITLHASDLLRAIPMVTSPFMRVKQHLDVWFVPYDDLWSKFSEFMTRKDMPRHSTGQNHNYAPCANLADIHVAMLSSVTEKDVVGRDYHIGAQKLLDLCGYGRHYIQSASQPDLYPKVNLWRIAAYNKIWYDEYRQPYYDNGMRLFVDDNNVELDDIKAAGLWNFDDLSCLSPSTSNINSSSQIDYAGRIKAMFQMRYRCWKKDLFTGVMPSTQFGAVSATPVSIDEDALVSTKVNYFGLRNVGVGGPLVGDGRGKSNPAFYANSPSNPDGANVYTFKPFDNTGADIKLVSAVRFDPLNEPNFDILELRNAEALQIWRENALRAGNRTSDNLRAHYGDDAEYNDHRCTLLGSISAPLNIGDIEATAATGAQVNGEVGDVVGKGTSTFNDKVFRFKAKTFGVIVAIHSLLPETEYEANGIDRMNQLLEYEDYFVPEFENLGLEAISTQDFYSLPVANGNILGYGPRYIGYKQKLDKVFNAFKKNSMFYHWASPKTDVTTVLSSSYTAMPLSLLYVNPALFDDNFVVGVNNSDQVLCDIYYDVDAVRRMSVVGLPNS